ncbi:MAG: hypothetical protein MUF52_16805, partial [Syntrophobacteraceae bacterium]|nr:hypothetical protein [Syntrophobacteraceae bacterium]
ARANEVLLTSHRVSSPSDDLMWNLLRDRFGLIVVDSFPCQGDDSHLSLAPDVDGVALVLESDMTVPDASGAGGAGLAEVLDLVARGVLIPRKVVNCMGAHVLLLTPLEG